MSGTRKILVTAALPYANGPIHLGHLLEYIQADIWVRFQRLRGNQCVFVCADDAHGTPIMLKAQQEGISPEALIARVKEEHARDFAGFLVDFDNFYSTHSPENESLTRDIYLKLRDRGHIDSREIEQAYDAKAKMFLPDRYIKGECPHCGSPDQSGDSCEVCLRTYDSSELVNPVSVVSGTTPIKKKSLHYFFRLQDFAEVLQTWMTESVNHGGLEQSVYRKLQEWFDAGLKDWDISRDAPYFGFEIPDAPNKYFYVWLDAPIGYIASFENLRSRRPDLDFDTFFAESSEAELYHFIGKDIVYFHALFWPAVLAGAGYRKPSGVFAHGFVTVDGRKMSKRRGTFIRAESYLQHLNPEHLRYFFASRLGPTIEDVDLNLEDFVQRVNSDLVGKLVNIASRCAPFIHKLCDGELGGTLDDAYPKDPDISNEIAKLFEQRQYGRAISRIMALADEANAYIADKAPWKLAKSGGSVDEIQSICTTGLNWFRKLMIYLKPVLPDTAVKAEAFFLETDSWTWEDADRPKLNAPINQYEPLQVRIDRKQVDRMIESNKPAETEKKTDKVGSPQIGIDDFTKVDLRVGEILSVELVDGADKLLQLTVDIGDDKRTVFAGIRQKYDPEKLQGKFCVVVANLKPKKMRFGTSEGMVLAAGPGGEDIFLISPDQGAQAGMQVK